MRDFIDRAQQATSRTSGRPRTSCAAPSMRRTSRPYIFPLLFFKRISDVYDEERAARSRSRAATWSTPLFPENHRFQIPDGLPLARRAGTERPTSARRLQQAMREIEQANPDTLLRHLRRRPVDQQGPPLRRAADGPDRPLLRAGRSATRLSRPTCSARPTST